VKAVLVSEKTMVIQDSGGGGGAKSQTRGRNCSPGWPAGRSGPSTLRPRP